MGKDKKEKKEKKDKKDKKGKKEKKDKKEKKEKKPDADEEPTLAPAPVIPPTETALCPEHTTNAIELYCLTCEKSICAICRESGAHQRVFHICKPVGSVYRQRISLLKDLIDAKLAPKKEAFEHELDKISGIIDKIRKAKLDVVLETKRDYDGVEQRLNDEEARKMSILNVELSNLRSDIQRIEEIDLHTRQVASDSQTHVMTDFLKQFTMLQEQAHFISDKAVKSDYHVDPDDFPREVVSRRNMLMQYSDLMNSHRIKDDMLNYLLDERQRLLRQGEEQEEYISRIEDATRTEMQNWIGLTDRFVTSLDSFKLKCAYCSAPLSGDIVNSFCEANVVENTHLEDVNLPVTNEQDFGAKHSGLHYFVKFS